MARKKNNKNDKEKRILHFHLYLNNFQREEYIHIYKVLIKNHERSYKALYEKMFTSTDEFFQELCNEVENSFNHSPFYPHYDEGDFIEDIYDLAIKRFDEEQLMHYQFELMSLSNLYQVFEQQLRKFLFEEITHRENEYKNQISFVNSEEVYGEFINNMRKITELLRELKLKFTSSNTAFEFNEFFDNGEVSIVNEELIVVSETWELVKEVNLISNTYKHGDGSSAKNLYKQHPEYFKHINKTRIMDMYRTTNAEMVLDIEKISYEKYANAMMNFWKELPEHHHGSVTMWVGMPSPKEKS